MQQNKLLHLNEKFLNSDGRLIEPQREGSDLVPTPNSVSSTDKDTKNLRNNGRMRVKFDKWLVHILFLCYLTILLNLAEGAEYGGC